MTGMGGGHAFRAKSGCSGNETTYWKIGSERILELSQKELLRAGRSSEVKGMRSSNEGCAYRTRGGLKVAEQAVCGFSEFAFLLFTFRFCTFPLF